MIKRERNSEDNAESGIKAEKDNRSKMKEAAARQRRGGGGQDFNTNGKRIRKEEIKNKYMDNVKRSKTRVIQIGKEK